MTPVQSRTALFDHRERDDASLARFDETLYQFLDRVDDVFFARTRLLLNAWFAELADSVTAERLRRAQCIGTSEAHVGEMHSLAVNLARLADKAVREYRAASAHLTAFTQTPGVDSLEGHTCLLRAIDHLENCIDAVTRAEGFVRTSSFAAIATAAQLESLKTVHQGVRAMRHSIQHADERIVKERRVLGELAATVIHVRLLASAGVDAVASASD